MPGLTVFLFRFRTIPTNAIVLPGRAVVFSLPTLCGRCPIQLFDMLTSSVSYSCSWIRSRSRSRLRHRLALCSAGIGLPTRSRPLPCTASCHIQDIPRNTSNLSILLYLYIIPGMMTSLSECCGILCSFMRTAGAMAFFPNRPRMVSTARSSFDCFSTFL